MSSCVIRKEDQPACQPWEMASFESSPHALQKGESAAVKLPTIDEITAIQEQARQEGYALGRSEGHTAGLAEGCALAAVETAMYQHAREQLCMYWNESEETK